MEARKGRMPCFLCQSLLLSATVFNDLLYISVGRSFESLWSLLFSIYVTGPEKTGLIYTKYTYSYYGAYLFFRVCYPNSISFIEILRILRLYQEICVKMLCC